MDPYINTDADHSATTTLRDYLNVLLRHKALIITTVITVVATVVIGLQLKTPVYEAQVTMLISAEKQVEAPYYKELMGYRANEIVLTQSEMVKSRPVIERVVKSVGLYRWSPDYEKKFCSSLKKIFMDFKAKMPKMPDKKEAHLTEEQKKKRSFLRAVEDLKKNIKVEPVRDTNLFTISAQDFSPLGAAILTNVISRSYVIFDIEQQLAEKQLKYGEKHLSVIQMKDNIAMMGKSLDGEPLSNIEAIGPASIKIVEQAQIPLKPTGPKKRLVVLLALVMGSFLGIMLAFGFEYLDDTVKGVEDIERLKWPFLGNIPEIDSGGKTTELEKDLFSHIKPKDPIAEAYRTIRTSVIFSSTEERPLKSIIITSPGPQEGKTTTLCNLGITMAQGQNRVLLVDADMRRPRLHEVFKDKNELGLSNFLSGQADFSKLVQKTEIDNLFLVSGGSQPPNPSELLASRKMKEFITHAKSEFDFILFDTPPSAIVTDAVILSQAVDGTIIVLQSGRTNKRALPRVNQVLKDARARIIGTLLNRISLAHSGYHYYSHYYGKRKKKYT